MTTQNVIPGQRPAARVPAFNFLKTGLIDVLDEYLSEKRSRYAELADAVVDGMLSPEQTSEFLTASYGSMNAAEREDVYKFLVLDRCMETGTLTAAQHASYVRARERVSEILRHLITN